MGGFMSKITMYDQWSKFKELHPNAIILFRTGRFYEMLEIDAYITNQLINIEMAYRKKGRGGKVPMTGFPPDGILKHTAKLTEQHLNYVIVEQLHEREDGDGILRRQIESVVTHDNAQSLTSFSEDYQRYLVEKIPLLIETKLLEEAKRKMATSHEVILEEICNLDLNQITGLDALKLLEKWQKNVKN